MCFKIHKNILNFSYFFANLKKKKKKKKKKPGGDWWTTWTYPSSQSNSSCYVTWSFSKKPALVCFGIEWRRRIFISTLQDWYLSLLDTSFSTRCIATNQKGTNCNSNEFSKYIWTLNTGRDWTIIPV